MTMKINELSARFWFLGAFLMNVCCTIKFDQIILYLSSNNNFVNVFNKFKIKHVMNHIIKSVLFKVSINSFNNNQNIGKLEYYNDGK